MIIWLKGRISGEILRVTSVFQVQGPATPRLGLWRTPGAAPLSTATRAAATPAAAGVRTCVGAVAGAAAAAGGRGDGSGQDSSAGKDHHCNSTSSI